MGFADTIRAAYNQDGTPRSEQSTPSLSFGPTDSASEYGARALALECQAMREAVEGTRNHQLNVSAYSLGQLVAGGELPIELVQGELGLAAHDTGLSDQEIRATMASGLTSGQKEPRQAPPRPRAPEASTLKPGSSKLSAAFDAEWLMAQEFPEINYVVDGIIPEGLTMLVAAPKIGKSWLVLGLAVANSNGGLALGCIPTKRAPVMYMALEDGPRRLQGRLRTLGITSVSRDLTFITSVPKGDMVETIREYMEQHDGRNPIVILDTLGKAMPPAFGGETQYDRDYRVLGALKGLADGNPGSSVIVVHHTRKMDGADFLDAVSGTQGIAGAADTVLLLKRSRHEQQANLQVTSRDAAEGEYLLDTAGTGNWILSGGSRTEAAAAAQTSKNTEGVGDRMAEVIALVSKYPEGTRAKDVATLLHLDPPTATTYLRRAYENGRIANPKRGLYTPVRSVMSVTTLPSDKDTNNRHNNPLQEQAS
ncbi:AAA family ATPase [Arthrobacter sp. CP30]